MNNHAYFYISILINEEYKYNLFQILKIVKQIEIFNLIKYYN